MNKSEDCCMKKKTKDRIQKRWWIFNDRLEDIISSIWLSDIGMFFFIITLPVSFIIKNDTVVNVFDWFLDNKDDSNHRLIIRLSEQYNIRK